MGRLPTLIFDLDGVLYNNPELYDRGVLAREKAWCVEQQARLAAEGKVIAYDPAKSRDMPGMMRLIAEVYKGATFQEKIEQFLDEIYRNPAHPLRYDLVPPNPALADAIQAYKDAGGQVMIYSNGFGCYIEGILGRLGLKKEDFAAIEGLDGHPFAHKPNAESFRRFLDGAGLACGPDGKYNVVYVEDTPENLVAGRNAGIRRNVWYNGENKAWPAVFAAPEKRDIATDSIAETVWGLLRDSGGNVPHFKADSAPRS